MSGPNKLSAGCWRFIGLATAFPFFVLVVSGCGPGDGKVLVTGVVTFDGNPMPNGYVIFTPEGGGTPVAGSILDGNFAFSAPPGIHRVEIEASRFVGPKNPIMGLQAREQYVPSRYNSASTLSQEVKPQGTNVCDFTLSSEAR
ncbi:MAG: hypothetical protein WD851_19740 [Pirellulales bacterium]